MKLCMVPHCFLLQVDHLLTLLVITLAGFPVSKLNADEMALVLQRHGEETLTGKRQVQAENLMLSNNTVSVCGGIASLIDERVSMQHWWDDIDRAELKYCTWKQSSQCFFFNHKFHVGWPGIKPRPPW